MCLTYHAEILPFNPHRQQAMRQEETWCLTCRDHSPGRRLLLSVAPLSSPVFLHSQTEGKTAQQRKTYQTRQLLTAQSNDSQNANSFLQEKQVVFFCLKITHHKRPKWMRTRALRALNSANQQPFNFFLMKNLESNELPALFISIIAAPVKLHTPRSPNYRTAGRT